MGQEPIWCVWVTIKMGISWRSVVLVINFIDISRTKPPFSLSVKLHLEKPSSSCSSLPSAPNEEENFPKTWSQMLQRTQNLFFHELSPLISSASALYFFYQALRSHHIFKVNVKDLCNLHFYCLVRNLPQFLLHARIRPATMLVSYRKRVVAKGCNPEFLQQTLLKLPYINYRYCIHLSLHLQSLQNYCRPFCFNGNWVE